MFFSMFYLMLKLLKNLEFYLVFIMAVELKLNFDFGKQMVILAHKTYLGVI